MITAALYRKIKRLRQVRHGQDEAVSQQLAADMAFYVQPASALSPEAGMSRQELEAALSIPRLQLVSQLSTQIGLAPDKALSAAEAAAAGQERVAQATVRYRKAMGKLGFAGGTHSTLHNIRELVIQSTLLDRSRCSAGLLLLQEVASLLKEVRAYIAQIDQELGGAANLPLPRTPLALGEFLEAWVVGSVTGFRQLQHPVLVALYWSHPFMTSVGDAHPGSYWGSGPRSAQAQVKLSARDQGNRIAKDIAGDVCLADLLELGRLNGQLQDLLVWLEGGSELHSLGSERSSGHSADDLTAIHSH